MHMVGHNDKHIHDYVRTPSRNTTRPGNNRIPAGG
jgi:hypothetical protein